MTEKQIQTEIKRIDGLPDRDMAEVHRLNLYLDFIEYVEKRGPEPLSKLATIILSTQRSGE